MFNDFRSFRGRVPAGLFGIATLAAILFVAGCSTTPKGPAITLSTGTSQAMDSGQAVTITANVANDSTGAGVTWTLTSGPGALSNQTKTSATYTASGGAGSAVITVSSVSSNTTTATLLITVSAPPSITTSSLPAGVEGTPYSQGITKTGGSGNLTFTVSAGTLPPGLNLSSSGTISGTPTGPNGTANFTIKVMDSSTVTPLTATQALSILINLPAAPSITTTTLPADVEGTAYSQQVAATGFGALTYTISAGALPTPLAMSSSGLITGTPAGPNGTANFTVKVTDSSNPPQSTTQALSIAINLPPAPSITTTTLPAGVEGTAYSQQVAATGFGALTYTISAGALPAPLAINSSGHITGTPTGPNGTANFTVKVTDSSNPPQSTTQALSILINLPIVPSITPASLPNGNVGTPYTQTLTVNNGLGPFTWSVSSGTPPAGLNLTPNNTTATINGIPTTAQSNVAFTIQVTDSSNPQQNGSQAYTVTINPPAPLSITTTSPLPQGTFNTVYNTTIAATGGIAPYTFSLDGASSALPASLNFSSSNNQGVISGTPTTAGTFNNIIVDVHDSQGVPATAQMTFTLVITAPALVFNPNSSSLPAGTQGASYNTTITVSGGVPPYSVSLDGASAALPANLNFNATSTGATITGTPNSTGTTNGIIVDVTDSESPQVTVKQTYSLTVSVPCGTGSESLLTGQYAFVLSGFDGSGNVALIGGVLTASGASGSSNLTGVMDMNLSGGVQSNLQIAAGSNYTVGSDGRGCMAITTTAGTQNYRFSLGASGNGHMIDFDTAGPFTTGVLRKQTASAFSTAQISGNYVFGATSPQDSAQGGGKLAAAGVLNLSAGSVTGGSEDFNLFNATSGIDTLDGVANATTWPASPITISSGSYSVSGTNGRGTLSIITGGFTTHDFVYVVSSAEVLFISSDARTVSSLSAGAAFLQTGGPFANTSLNGKSVVYNSKVSSGGGSVIDSSVSIGIVTTTGASATFSFAGYNNGGGNISTPTNNSASGTFSVAANGRVTLTVSGAGNNTPEFYLISPNNGFSVFSGNGVDSGLMEAQTSTSVSGTYAYGSIAPQAPGEKDSTGAPVFSSPNVTGTGDDNAQGTLSPNGAISNTYSVDANGVVFMPASCTPGTNCNKIGTVITSSKFVMMDAKSSSSQGGTTTPSMSVVDK